MVRQDGGVNKGASQRLGATVMLAVPVTTSPAVYSGLLYSAQGGDFDGRRGRRVSRRVCMRTAAVSN